ncbi:MAG: hypothetical protein QOJ07_1940, partial [Thermoleophilaceae bacterium]|nr:hypothetical protein [Thermoleophilaceae bacterium]
DLKGLDKGSLVLEENLRKVLAKVDASDHPLVTNIRVSPIRVDLITRNADGLRKDVSYDPGFNKTESDFGAGDDKAIRASKLDASAPERMARSVGERTGLGTDSLDYVTLSPSPTSAGETEWYLFLDKGPFKSRQWVAAPDGRDLRHPGEPSLKEKAATRRQARQMKAEQRRTQRAFAQQSACLNRATDANAAARCVERYQP